ncbi:MAG: 23S rRNA (uracil-5-)-methyltransferase RumA [Nitrospirae bacterium RBG_19FT_COMBO_42_15]|nr:MAG: 23S rRNA (uracil-5-)-methyltransferase RumA [Nitrospirae bacterium RBG_19FT_COMBO_42_15]
MALHTAHLLLILMLGNKIELHIERLVYGGKGLGRHNNMVVFVPDVITGEKTLVEISARKKDYAEAELIQVLEPSPHRIAPACPIYHDCGGCQWMHIDYPFQVQSKREILAETFKRTLKMDDIAIQPLIPSSPLNYRQRVQFKVHPVRDKAPKAPGGRWQPVSNGVKHENSKYQIGYYKKETHQLVDVNECLLLRPLLNKALKKIEELLNSGKISQLKDLKELHMHCSSDERAMVFILYADEISKDELNNLFKEIKEAVSEATGIIFIDKYKKRIIAGSPFIEEELQGISFRISGDSFSQIDWVQNKILVKLALDYIGDAQYKNALDLFCGIGNFTLFIAKNADNVIGMDSGKTAIDDAKYNSKKNLISNISFMYNDVKYGMASLLAEGKRFDLVLIDPPRNGVGKDSVNAIVRLQPSKIIYISCNPVTLSRDIAHFKAKGYELKRLQAVDMFPQTYHIETVAELVK